MSNPEFKRNLWLSFSTHRLIAMPALLGLIFLAVSLSDSNSETAQKLYYPAVAAFIFIVWMWGARNTNSAIIDEFRDKTWDQQRMSALKPWTMTWGKLFGSTAYNWYGGAMCLAVAAISGIIADQPNVAAMILTLCAVGITIHAALIALNLHIVQFESSIIMRGGLGWLVIIAIFMLIPLYSVDQSSFVIWWSNEIGKSMFWLGSSLLFAACAVFAAWRVVNNALQVRTLPWAWPAFACILAVYLGGFARGAHGAGLLCISGVLVSSAMTYVGLLTEPNTLLRWRKLRLLQTEGNWRGWLEHLPLWPASLALALLFALLMQLIPQTEHSGHTMHPSLMPPQYALVIATMTLRDACVLLFFSFSNNSKRAVGTAMLYLFVLNVLLPLLASIAGLQTARYFLMPFEAGHDPWSGVLIMTIHITIAIALINWRLRSTGQQ